MNKGDLINAIAYKANITKSAAEKALSAFTGGVTKALRKGERVTLVGFGTFDTATRAARKGRNPRTGDTISIPSMKTPKFRAGKALKDAVK